MLKYLAFGKTLSNCAMSWLTTTTLSLVSNSRSSRRPVFFDRSEPARKAWTVARWTDTDKDFAEHLSRLSVILAGFVSFRFTFDLVSVTIENDNVKRYIRIPQTTK